MKKNLVNINTKSLKTIFVNNLYRNSTNIDNSGYVHKKYGFLYFKFIRYSTMIQSILSLIEFRRI